MTVLVLVACTLRGAEIGLLGLATMYTSHVLMLEYVEQPRLLKALTLATTQLPQMRLKGADVRMTKEISQVLVVTIRGTVPMQDEASYQSPVIVLNMIQYPSMLMPVPPVFVGRLNATEYVSAAQLTVGADI